MSRYLWIAYFVGVMLFATVPSGAWLLLHCGPVVQWWLDPITSEQTIPPDTVARLDDGRLCWTRWIEKLKVAEPWNFDVFLDRPRSGDRSFPDVTDRYTGQSWHTKGALGTGRHAQDQCVPLPALTPGEPVVLSQTIHYHGWRDWWDLAVPLPAIHYTAPP